MAQSPLTGSNYDATDVKSGDDAYKNQQYVYGRRGRKFGQFAQDSFGQNLQKTNKGVSEAPDNVYADSPWARWYRNFYETRVPAQYAAGRLLQPDKFSQYGQSGNGGENTAAGYENYLNDFNKNGAGAGPIGDYRTSLNSIADLVQRVAGGDKSSLDEFQKDEASGLATDPEEASAIIMSLLGDQLGFSGGRSIQNQLQRMTQNYYAGGEDQSGAGAGPFFVRALQQLGLR